MLSLLGRILSASHGRGFMRGMPRWDLSVRVGGHFAIKLQELLVWLLCSLGAGKLHRLRRRAVYSFNGVAAVHALHSGALPASGWGFGL